MDFGYLILNIFQIFFLFDSCNHNENDHHYLMLALKMAMLQ